ncbi:hypothetical protein GQX74_013125 [Glossina fuscipes]|nr:hypothetical protein GQX74_013125 [Glossina fuscipes]
MNVGMSETEINEENIFYHATTSCLHKRRLSSLNESNHHYIYSMLSNVITKKLLLAVSSLPQVFMILVDIHVVFGIIAVGGVGNVLKVGWQLSGDLSAPDLPAIVLSIAVAAVVAEQNDDGADEGVAAVDLGT